MISKRFRNDQIPTLKINDTQRKEIKIVQNKIAEGKYQFEEVKCPICKNTKEFEPISEKDRYGFYFPLKACKVCGLIFANPRLREEDLNDFYEQSHQKKIYIGNSTPTDIYFKNQHKRGKKVFENISTYIQDKTQLNVLEVGCAAGGILKPFKDAAHNIKGIDLTPEYIAYGRDNEGLNLHVENLFDLDTNIKYDIIIYSHVLEHLTSPESHLQFISKILKPDGILYIEVPGIKSSYQSYGDILKYIQNAHPLNFSFATLSNLMVANNFTLINEPNERIISVWKYKVVQKEKIKNDYNDIMTYFSKNECSFVRYYYTLISKIKSKTPRCLKQLLKT